MLVEGPPKLTLSTTSSSIVDSVSADTPPAYRERSQSRRPTSLTSSSPPSSTPGMPLLSSSSSLEKPRSASFRFLKATMFAVATWAILMAITHGVATLAIAQTPNKNSPLLIQMDKLQGGPSGSDGSVVECFPHEGFISGQEILTTSPYSTVVTFSVPTSADLVYLLSRGRHGHGSLQIELSDKSDGDIEVETVIHYYHKAVLDLTQVCLLERDGGKRGVGIYTPEQDLPGHHGHHGGHDMLRFEITVRIPRSGTKDSPLFIKALETDMGVWTHGVDNLEELVNFGSISLSCANTPIHVAGVSAATAAFRTINSPINGRFNISDTLVLKTVNAPINADIRMQNADGHKPTMVDAMTLNANIKAAITLASTATEPDYPPAFHVFAETKNAPVSIAFLDAPTSPFSKLDLIANTVLSDVDITLHPSFEGSIYQSSTWSPVRLESDEGTEDPSGQGRSRSISKRGISSTLDSRVWWGKDELKDNLGKVRSTTTFAKNTVRLQ